LALTPCQDRASLAAFLGRRPALNAYAIGDLDDAFWPDTDFYALQEDGPIHEVILLYKGITPPILLAYQNENLDATRQLLADLIPQLPDTVYAHLTASLLDMLEPRFHVKPHGEHYMMELVASEAVLTADPGDAQLLGLDDFDELRAFFDVAHPEHWFHRPMLAHGLYMGLRDGSGALVAAGGTHVYSPRYRVATLGNVVTAPARRGRGFATRLTAALCQQLLPSMDTIGLNVRADNAAALRVYRKLGFEIVTNYWEMLLTAR